VKRKNVEAMGPEAQVECGSTADDKSVSDYSRQYDKTPETVSISSDPDSLSDPVLFP
jgi:hypothetical protein